MARLIELNLNATQVPGVVPHYVMRLQSFLPGKEWVRDIYFQLTWPMNLGWKHSSVKTPEQFKKYRPEGSGPIFITITKNPYSWLLSLYRNPYHQHYDDKPAFEDFLRCPWKTVARDNIKKKLRNPIELWNVKNRSYLQLNGKNALNLTAETLFQKPEQVIYQISHQFSIPLKTDGFINFEQSTKDQYKSGTFYREYYLNEIWKKELSKEAVSIINESLDPKLMNHFEYPFL